MILVIDTVICGDCIEVLSGIKSSSIDMVFADPPFNIGKKYDSYNDNKTDDEYIEWSSKWISECYRVLKDTGSIYICIGDEFVSNIDIIMKKCGFHQRNWLIWYYTFGTHQIKKFNRCKTHILYSSKNISGFKFNVSDIRVPSRRLEIGDKRANPLGKTPDDIWKFPRITGTSKERIKGHPCQMPINLIERAILASTDINDIVLDPFAGTGSTGIACIRNNRKYILIEMSENYVEIIEERIIREKG